ncbi:MAG: CPBP family intramembrane glutamic endopeptidase [Cyclobacteriaceae bacterium]
MQSDLFQEQRPAWTSVIFIFLSCMLGFIVVGPLIGFMLALPFFEGDLLTLQTKLASPTSYPELKLPLFIIQASATLIGLIIVPALYVKAFERKSVFNLFRNKTVYNSSLALSGLLIVAFMVPNSVFIEWNANVTMPEFLRGFEAWARDKEDVATALTNYLTTFSSTGQFLFAFFAIAVLPGIGEELVFRGMLQPELRRATGNMHVAIWVSAIMFSAIHLQFFGFVPRMLLGVLFGYLYFWSGNIIVPMFAHFVNNGFSLIMLYLYQTGNTSLNIDSSESAPLLTAILFTIITFGILLYLKKFHEEKNTFLT